MGGRGHRGRRRAAARDDRREIAHAGLHEALAERERLERGIVQADPRLAAHDRDRGRNGALGAHRGLQLAGHLEVAPARQSVGDQGALEGDHGTPVPERRGDVIGDAHRGQS